MAQSVADKISIIGLNDLCSPGVEAKLYLSPVPNNKVVLFKPGTYSNPGQYLRLINYMLVKGYCVIGMNHAYELYLGIENIDHSRTKAYSPQTNGICERFHKTMQEEC